MDIIKEIIKFSEDHKSATVVIVSIIIMMIIYFAIILLKKFDVRFKIKNK